MTPGHSSSSGSSRRRDFALGRVLDRVASDPRQFVLRGELLPSINRNRCRRLLHPHREDDGTITPATFREVPRRWVVIDFDERPGPLSLRSPRGELAAEYCRSCCHPVVARIVLVGAVGIAGFKPGVRIKLAYWLARPALGRELERHLEGCPIDVSTLRAVQPIYVARPILQGVADPIARRTGPRGRARHGRPAGAARRGAPAGARTHTPDGRRYVSGPPRSWPRGAWTPCAGPSSKPVSAAAIGA